MTFAAIGCFAMMLFAQTAMKQYAEDSADPEPEQRSSVEDDSGDARWVELATGNHVTC